MPLPAEPSTGAVDVDATATLVQTAAAAAGLTAARFEMVRIGNNVVFGSADMRVIARVAYTSRQPLQRHVTHLRAVAQLAAAGAPIVAALHEPCLLADGRVVTFWPMHDPAGAVSLEMLVELMSELHRSVPVDGLRIWDPERSYLARWRDRSPLIGTNGVPGSVHEFLDRTLHQRVATLSETWAARSGTHPVVVVHGDLHPDNVVRRRGGTLALVDLDVVAAGPPEVDVAAVRFHHERRGRRRNGRPAVDRIRAGYGRDADDGLVAQIWAADETIDCAWLACLWGLVEGADIELLHRVERWDDPTVRWRPF